MSHFRFSKLYQSLELSQNLFIRNLKNRYLRSSTFGLLWILVYPLLLTLISFLVFSVVLKTPTNDNSFIFSILIGFIFWTTFSQSLSKAPFTFISNRSLIRNTNIPKYTLIIAELLLDQLDFIIRLLFYILAFFFFFKSINISQLFILIFLFLNQTAFLYGLKVLISIGNVFSQSMRNIVQIVIQILFYISPIIYSFETLPTKLQKILIFNPVTIFVQAYRSTFIENKLSLNFVLAILVLSFSIAFIGHVVLNKTDKVLPERI